MCGYGAGETEASCCQRFADLLSEYLDGELDAGTREAVAAHLERCPPCSRAAAELADMIAALHRVGVRTWALPCAGPVS